MLFEDVQWLWPGEVFGGLLVQFFGGLLVHFFVAVGMRVSSEVFLTILGVKITNFNTFY